ncbi:MAG: aspartate carbamoyltransferase [Dehalococcoidia bacterium]
MTLVGRHLISINDFSNEEIELVLELAEQMDTALEKKEQLHSCDGKELYTIFYEASTRTRSSFETAMHRLGGTVVSHAEAQTTSSVAKGENIADTVRVLEKYADIMVMRHPLDGSTRLAADHSQIPIISGGDGGHEHPTQTLLDLYTIKKEKGSIKGMNVALCGDLRHGRTVHSLAVALARFGAEITCIAPEGFELPDHIRNALKDYKCKLTEYKSLEDVTSEGSLAIHHSRGKEQHQEGFMDFLLESLDVLYFTRLQRERFAAREATDVDQESYRINKQLLARSREDAVIMHPLPRINELAYEVDQDKRAAYFRQAGYGVPVRMALIALILGVVKARPVKMTRPGSGKMPEEIPGAVCSNEHCVTNVEGYAAPKFYRDPHNPRILKCYYCDWVNKQE